MTKILLAAAFIATVAMTPPMPASSRTATVKMAWL